MLDVLDLPVCPRTAVFPVNGEGDGFFETKDDFAGPPPDNGFTCFPAQQMGDELSCLSGIAGGLDQQDLKEAVVENNIVQLNHPADRKGVEDTAEDVIAGIVGSVEQDRGFKGADAAHR